MGYPFLMGATLGKSGEAGVSAALKDQLALISLLVLFAGFVATDTYYAAFGLRFQLLGLSLQNLTYRGLTALVTNWLIGLVYLISILWLAVAPKLAAHGTFRWRKWIQPATYGVILCVLVAAYFGAIAAGRNAALRDMGVASTLPIIKSISDSKGDSYSGFRLLLSDQNQVVVLKTVTNPDVDVPLIHILRRTDVSQITLTRP